MPFTSDIRCALSTARAVIVGPMRWNTNVRDLLLHIPSAVPKAYRALIPHRDMIGDPAFALIAQRYNYVQMKAEEIRLLDGATDNLVVNARRLSFLLGEDTECAVTAAEARGYLWSGRWLPIDPPKVTVVDDTCCGDSFAAAYVIGRVFLGQSADRALLYAIEAGAATATQIGLSKPLPYR